MSEEKEAPRAEEFDLESWIKDGIRGMKERCERRKRIGLPHEFKHHTKAAHKEMLLAVRSLVDTAIQELEQEAHMTPDE
jgi:hypothetical protein